MANRGAFRERVLRKLELSHKLSDDARVGKARNHLNTNTGYSKITGKEHYVNIYRIFLLIKDKHNKL